MALPDFRIQRWVSGRLPDFRASLSDLDPAADFTYEEVSTGPQADYLVQVVADNATPRPDFRLTLSKGAFDFTSSMPPSVSYSRSGPASAPNGSGLTAFAADVPQRTTRGLLLEPARTNVSLQSIDTNTTEWDITGGSQVFGQADPLGGTGATLITADGISGQHKSRASRLATVSYVLGDVVTISRLLPVGSIKRVQLTGSGNVFGVDQYANFDLDTLTVTASLGCSAAIVAIGAYRLISMTLPVTATAAGTGGLLCPLVTGLETRDPITTVGGTLGDWGCQVEVGAGPSSLIPTTTASVARGLPTATLVAPSNSWTAVYGLANTVVSGSATKGSTFDLVTGRPWIGLGNELKSLRFL